MGTINEMINILHWKADWQADLDEGFQDLEEAFPNFWVDLYPYAIGGPPYSVPEAFQDVAEVYLPGWFVGNPFSEPLKVTCVEDLIAYGFGSTTTQESQDAIGRGIWMNSTWKVVISRQLDTGDPNDVTLTPDVETPLAFAVWDGSSNDVGARKSVSSWVTLEVGAFTRKTPPTASFDYSPLTPKLNEAVSFLDTSEDADGEIISWDWTFGDGSTSIERNPDHEYSSKGSFNVTLVVTDDDGAKDTYTQIVTLENIPPVADFSYSPTDPIENSEIIFMDESSDPDGIISGWNWDFGDTQESDDQHATYAYTEAGVYTVTLSVVDDDGQSSMKTIEINIGPVSFWENVNTSVPLLVITGIIVASIVGLLIKNREKLLGKKN
jgi:PKD repeat protein